MSPLLLILKKAWKPKKTPGMAPKILSRNGSTKIPACAGFYECCMTVAAQLQAKVVKKKEAEAAKFRDYISIGRNPCPKPLLIVFLAILRGENEGFLNRPCGS